MNQMAMRLKLDGYAYGRQVTNVLSTYNRYSALLHCARFLRPLNLLLKAKLLP